MPFHTSRVWGPPKEVPDVLELTEKLATMSWCLCDCFSFGDYLLLNDAISPDGQQEFAVVKKLPDRTFLEVASINFSAKDPAKILETLEQIQRGAFNNSPWSHYAGLVELQIDKSIDHCCDHCA